MKKLDFGSILTKNKSRCTSPPLTLKTSIHHHIVFAKKHRKDHMDQASQAQKISLLFDLMSEGMVEEDAEGRIIFWNRAALDILDMTADELQGKTSYDPIWQAIHDDGSEFPGDEHPAEIALKTGEPVSNSIMGLK